VETFAVAARESIGRGALAPKSIARGGGLSSAPSDRAPWEEPPEERGVTVCFAGLSTSLLFSQGSEVERTKSADGAALVACAFVFAE
jgi:hypothetical protein